MTPPTYSAARAVAARLQPHFAHAHPTAPLPDTSVIETIIDAAFWASLQREEGYEPRISLAYLAPTHTVLPLTFERPIVLASPALTRLAPAVERPGIHLGVWGEPGGGLHVWGATRRLPPFCLVVEVVAPGLLVIKQSRGEELGKFVNLAVLQADQVKLIDQRAAQIPDCPAVLTSLLGLDSKFDSGGSAKPLIQIAISMRAHGRGGSLLVVPAGNATWRESILHPITYSVAPLFSVLADLLRVGAEGRDRSWQDEVRRAVEGIAGLTAVDGATVITDRYDLLAFGVKIVRRKGSPQVSQVIVTEPVEGSMQEIGDPSQLGGTRHLSAAQFVHDQRDTLALVASQDGRFTVFAWSACEDTLHAHRIDALLL